MTRQKRRIFAILMTLSFIALFFTLPLMENKPLTFVAIALFASLLTQPVRKGLKLSLGNLWEQKDSDLDERQQAIKNQAYRWSYRVMIFASIIVIMIGRTVLQSAVPDTPERAFNLLLWFMVGFALLQLWLPQFLIAWLEPDDIQADPLKEKA